MTAGLLAASGVIGLCIGSFLTVVISRVPERESLVRPRSHCRACQAPVAVRDNIPVFSWVWLRGRCRRCQARITARYPLVELATAGLFVGAALRFGPSWELPAFCAFGAALLAISVIDLDTQLIHKRVFYPSLVVCAVLLAGAGIATGRWVDLERAAIGGVAGFLVLLVIHVVSPNGMGFGDVRLAGLIGMMLGWLGVREIVLGLFAAFLLASVVGIGLMITRIRGRKDAVPFGPFLAAGALVAVLFGPAILGAYGH